MRNRMMVVHRGQWMSLVMLVLAASLLFVSCKKEKKFKEDATLNEWIYQQMKTNYLYTNHLKTVTPNYDQTSEAFFKSLLSPNPADDDGKHPNRFGQTYFYSYMERAEATKAEVGTVSYGMEVMAYHFVSGSSPSTYMFRVLYVQPGSVADQAKIKRGDWIIKVNGQAVTGTEQALLRSGSGVTLNVGLLKTKDGAMAWLEAPRDVVLPAATLIFNSPVFMEKVINQGASKIGYLVYNRFDTGPAGFDDKAYDNDLRAAFARLKAAGVTDLVLDLRYNGGGYISSCILLSSMIVPQSDLGGLFAIQKFNANHPSQRELFLKASDVASQNLDLSRLYVLTGRHTASASELLINALKPYLTQVTLIGAQTEGKRVGMLEYKKDDLKIHPVVSMIYNAHEESNYKNGFKPDFAVPTDQDEIQSMDPWSPLGDLNEPLLAKAVALITGTTRASDMTAFGGAFNGRVEVFTHQPYGVSGAILDPNTLP